MEGEARFGFVAAVGEIEPRSYGWVVVVVIIIAASILESQPETGRIESRAGVEKLGGKFNKTTLTAECDGIGREVCCKLGG